MKHKTWFRLVLHAIGVLLIGLSIPSLANSIGWFIADAQSTSGGSRSASFISSTTSTMRIAALAGASLQMALGLYLLIGGKWLTDFAIPSNRPYCPNCGYDLSHNNGERCSECGVTLPPRDAPPNGS